MEYITTSNLYWEGFKLDGLKKMPFIDNEIERCQAVKGDLLVCEGGDIGRACIWPYENAIMLQNHIHKLRAILPLCTKYFYYIFYLYNQTGIIGGKGIGIQGFSSRALHNTIVPFPPLNEQFRIANRMDGLLPIVEKYNRTQVKLDALNESIKEKLQKSILQEAIQGRLVPQIPEEGTTQELLAQIKQEKIQLVKEGKLKKTALQDSVIFKGGDNRYYEQVGSQVSVIEEDIPFDIPDSWCWMRLGCLVYCETGLAYSKDNLNEKSESMIRVLRGGNIDEGRWSVKDDDVMISSKYVREELLLKRGTFITPAVTSLERMAKTALIETDLYDTVAGGFVLMLKPFFKHDAILGYLNLLFQTTYYKQYCIGITNKSGQAFYNLSRQKLMKCMIPIAPIKEMIRIVTKYESLDL